MALRKGQTTCKRGHSLVDDANVRLYQHPRSGYTIRICRACRRHTKATQGRAYQYGATWEEVTRLREAQGHRCAICKRHADDIESSYDPLILDHDHATGLLRGWICQRCNTLLGQIEANRDLLDAASYYLTAPPAALMRGEHYQRDVSA